MEKQRRLEMMYSMAFAAALLCAVSVPAPAQSYQGGQYPAPASLAAQLALPACGFAATESWGPNGAQYCDPRNIQGSYPRHTYGHWSTVPGR
jgi:hypothetical protein